MESGNAAEWVAAVGTVGAFAATVVLLWFEQRARRAQEAEQRRQQARLVSAWTKRWDSMTVDCVIRNGSSEPIYDVSLRTLDFPSDRTVDSADFVAITPETTVDAPLRPPEVAPQDPILRLGVPIDLRFTDSAGHHWLRDRFGVLRERRYGVQTGPEGCGVTSSILGPSGQALTVQRATPWPDRGAPWVERDREPGPEVTGG